MRETSLISAREIPLALQGMMIVGRCPSAGVRITGSSLEARFALKPLALGRKYVLDLCYSPGGEPRTFVRFPVLADLVPRRAIPHLWSRARGELCLYYNPLREWNPALLLADSVVAWASEWLYHFEHWEISDVWDGGGTVH